MLWEQFAQRDAPVAGKDHLGLHVRAIYLRDELAAASARREDVDRAVRIFPDGDDLRDALLTRSHHRGDGAGFGAESQA